MFTGMVEELGIVRAVRRGRASSVLSIGARRILSDLRIGDSVAVNGVCLTASGLDDTGFAADVMHETLDRSSLGSLTGENKAIYQVGGLILNDDIKQVTVDDEPVKMTPIEYNILLLLVKNQEKVFSIDQIYESIWNEDAIGVDNTVAVHIRHIREKIEINPKEPRYLKVVWGVGYKIEAGA